MSLNKISDVLMYVDPATSKVEKIVFFSVFGITERIDSEWEPTTREGSGIDDLKTSRIYELDWDTDFLPMDAPDDGKEHAAIELFDAGNLSEEDAKKYGKLYFDPEEPEDLDLEKYIG